MDVELDVDMSRTAYAIWLADWTAGRTVPFADWRPTAAQQAEIAAAYPALTGLLEALGEGDVPEVEIASIPEFKAPESER